MRVIGRRCCGNSLSGGGGQEEGARMTILQGGPKFEVTPLLVAINISHKIVTTDDKI